MKKRIAVCGLGLLLALSAAAAQKPGLKVYVSVDMEGIWGVVHGDQVSATGGDYGAARRWMAEDVNAVVSGLFEAGASEVLVNDSHGSMRNIPADLLDPRAALLSGTPKPLLMMEGLDASFAAAVFVGYHARAGSFPGVLDHTISGATVYAVRINGREHPEMGINAAIAGALGVPVVMLTGDAETCRQAKELFGEDMTAVAVKTGVGRTAARMLPRAEALAALKAGARTALGKRGAVKPFVIAPPLRFDLEFHNSGQSELPLMVPGVERTGPRSVGFPADDFITGFKFLRALISLGGIV